LDTGDWRSWGKSALTEPVAAPFTEAILMGEDTAGFSLEDEMGRCVAMRVASEYAVGVNMLYAGGRYGC
jgi:hypothetical protein